MADKVNIQDTGLKEFNEHLELIQKNLVLDAESMSNFIDVAIRLRKNLDSTDTIKFTKAQEDLNKTYQESATIEIEVEKLRKAKIETQLKEINLQKQLQKEQEKTRKSSLDINEVLKREVKTRGEIEQKIKDLRVAKKNLSTVEKEDIELNKKASIEINKLTKVIKENEDAERKRTTNIGRYYKDIMHSVATTGAVLLAGVASWKTFKSILESTDTVSDKLEETIHGVRNATSYLFKTIASGNFQNLWQNMKEAYDIGVLYAKQQDDIENKTRELSITEKKARTEQLQLLKKLKAVDDETGEANIEYETDKNERIKAGNKYLEIERGLQQKRLDIANQALEAEVKLYQSALKNQKISNEEVKDIVRKYSANKAIIEQGESYNKILARKNELDSRNDKIQTTATGGILRLTLTRKEQDELAIINRYLETTTNQVKHWGDLATATGKINKVELDKLALLMGNVIDAQNSYEENTKRVQTMIAKLMKDNTELATREASKMQEIETEKAKSVQLTDEEIQKSAEDLLNYSIKAYEKRYKAFKKSGDEIDTSEEAFLRKELQNYETSLQMYDLGENEKAKIAEKIAELQIKLSDDVAERDKRNEEEKRRRRKETIEMMVDLSQQGFDTVGMFLENEAIKVEQDEQRKVAAVEARLAKELKIAGDNEEAKNKAQIKADAEKEKIQKESAKKQAEIARKQAILEKVAGLAQVTYSTSMAIAKAWATSPLSFGLPWSAAAAVMGGLQAAAILAKPLPEIPAFKDGKKAGSTDILGIVGDEGMGHRYTPEGIKKDGKYIGITPGVPTLMNIPAGVEIVPNKILEKEITRFDGAKTENIEMIELNQNLKTLIRVTKNKPETYIDMNEHSFVIHAKRGLNNIEYYNKSFRHKC